MWKPWKTVRNIFPTFSKPPINCWAFSQQKAQLWSKGHYKLPVHITEYLNYKFILESPTILPKYNPTWIRWAPPVFTKCSHPIDSHEMDKGEKDTLFETRDETWNLTRHHMMQHGRQTQYMLYITSTVYTSTNVYTVPYVSKGGGGGGIRPPPDQYFSSGCASFLPLETVSPPYFGGSWRGGIVNTGQKVVHT